MHAPMLPLSLLLAVVAAWPQPARAEMDLQPLDEIRTAAITALAWAVGARRRRRPRRRG